MPAAAFLPLFSWMKGARGGLPRVPRDPQINRGGSPGTVGSRWGPGCGQGTSQQLQEHRLLLPTAGPTVACVGTEFNAGLTPGAPGEPQQHHTCRPCRQFQESLCVVGGGDLHGYPTPRGKESVEKGLWLQGTRGEGAGLLKAGLSHVGSTPTLVSKSTRGRNRENSRLSPPPRPSTAHRAPLGSALDTLVGSLAERHTACHVLTGTNNE